jgi:hypothetical protein
MSQSLISTGLPSYPAGLSDEDASLVVPLYKALNTLAQQLSLTTGNVQYSSGEMANLDQLTALLNQKTQKIFVKAGEALSYGNVVTLSLSAGKIVAYKADASVLNKPAHAIIDDAGGIALNDFGEAILLTGRTLGITGTTFGTVYYLSTAGQVQTARPHGPTILTQVVGYGLGSAGFMAAIEAPGDTSYGTFLDTTTQTQTAINTAKAITFNTTDISRGISLGSPTSRIVVSKQGVYNFQFSLQLDKTSGGTGSVYIWARINGNNVANSASHIRIQGNNAELVVAWNFVYALNANDYFELMWEVDATDVQLQYFAGTGVHPAVPSILMSVTNNL